MKNHETNWKNGERKQLETWVYIEATCFGVPFILLFYMLHLRLSKPWSNLNDKRPEASKQKMKAKYLWKIKDEESKRSFS